MSVLEYIINLGYREGDKLYSTIFGCVDLISFDYEGDEIVVEDIVGNTYVYSSDGVWREHIVGECTLWPDDTCRDWGSAPAIEHEKKYNVYDYLTYNNKPVEIVATESYGEEVTKVRILGSDIVVCPEYDVVKTEHFDKKLYRPYDKVIVRCNDSEVWHPETVSYVDVDTDGNISVFLQGSIQRKALEIVPYDYTTEQLIGSRNNAPKYFL